MVLTRKVEPFSSVPPESRDPFRVWRDEEGAACAYGYHSGAAVLMEWPTVGRYRFASGSGLVEVTPLHDVPMQTVDEVFRRFVLPLALVNDGSEALHASAVLTANGVVAFCAESHGGKSTLGYGLSRRGFPQWADDTVVFQRGGADIRCRRLPFFPRLRSESAGFFSRSSAIPLPPAAELPESAPLIAVCILSRSSQPAPHLARLWATDGLMAVLSHARVLDPGDLERRREMLENYLRLVAVAPVYCLEMPYGLGQLHAVLDRLGDDISDRFGQPCAAADVLSV